MNDSEEDFQEPDPEDFELTPKPKGYLQQIPHLSSINLPILFVLLFLFVSYLYWTDDVKTYLWVSRDSIFVQNEYWRLLSALFVHSGLMHLLNNSLLFTIFGALLSFFYGSVVFPLAAFVVGMITNAITIYFYAPHVHLIGASGMVYGMVGMWIVFYVAFEKRFDLFMRVFRVLGFSLVLLFPTTFKKEVSYMAHGVGFLVGIVAALFLIPMLREKIRAFERRMNLGE